MGRIKLHKDIHIMNKSLIHHKIPLLFVSLMIFSSCSFQSGDDLSKIKSTLESEILENANDPSSYSFVNFEVSESFTLNELLDSLIEESSNQLQIDHYQDFKRENSNVLSQERYYQVNFSHRENNEMGALQLFRKVYDVKVRDSNVEILWSADQEVYNRLMNAENFDDTWLMIATEVMSGNGRSVAFDNLEKMGLRMTGWQYSDREMSRPNEEIEDDGVRTIDITGIDEMKFVVSEVKEGLITGRQIGQYSLLVGIEAVPGEELRIRLNTISNLPKTAMAHNLVLVDLGTNIDAFARASITARDNAYIASDYENQVIKATDMLGDGEYDTITFTAPEQPGEYDILCTFPGHYAGGMISKLIVK